MIFPQRVADGVIAVKNVNPNGLPRAIRTETLTISVLKYVRRSMALREQKSAYVGMRKVGVL